MAQKSTSPRRVKTSERVFGIIEALQELDGARVTELAASLDLANSTVHDHLVTLEEQGYVRREDGVYYISLKFFQHGMYAKRREEVSKVSQPILDKLVEETGEIAWLAVEEHGKAVYLNKALGDQAIQPYGTLGERVDLYNIAAGKAILAHLPEEYAREIIERTELKEHTENTITDPDALFERLELIRERGYALNRDEVIPGFRAVASPIITNENLHGAVALSGPKSRMQGQRFEDELPERVMGATNEIEMLLQSEF